MGSARFWHSDGMRIGLFALLAIHAAIHLMGFLKWSKLAEVPQLSGRTWLPLSLSGSWVFAALWLAALLLLGAAAFRLVREEGWWLFGLAGLLLSQGVIVFAWHDAKFGTLVNLALLLPIAVAASQSRFDEVVNAEVRALLAARPFAPSIVTREEVLSLPPPVRRWLETSGVIGRSRPRTVRLTQRGDLRTSPEAAWMPATAEQFFSIDEPAFVWKVEARMLGVLPFVGRDKYVAGTGHMLIKAASLVNVVDASDEKIAHGAMLRFLGEIVWFPSAAVSAYIEWEAVDARRAKATMRHAGLTASAVFSFDDQGRVVGLNAERYLGGGAEARLTPWSVSCSEWQVHAGNQIPVRGDVIWNLPSGDFNYFRWQITSVEYDPDKTR